MGIKCCVNYCTHNDGNGHCTKEEIYISDAETGEPTSTTVPEPVAEVEEQA